MILSNEPGYYKTGDYGIRIENLVVVTRRRAVAGGERPMQCVRDADAGADRPAADRAGAADRRRSAPGSTPITRASREAIGPLLDAPTRPGWSRRPGRCDGALDAAKRSRS